MNNSEEPTSLEEANRLWKLCRYAEAHAQFSKAAEQNDDLLIALQVSGMLTAQGCPKDALNRLDDALVKFRDASPDPEVLALAEVLQAILTAATTAKFSGPLKATEELYNQRLLDVPAEQYNQRMTILLCTHMRLIVLAENNGFDVTVVSRPTLDFFHSLYDRLIEKEYFDSALDVKNVCYSMKDPESSSETLERPLSKKNVPDLVQADNHMECSDIHRQQGRLDEARMQLDRAGALYERASHACGPSLVAVRKYSIDIESHGSQLANIRSDLLRLKSKLESYQHYGGVREALKCLYVIARREQDDKFRVELDHEFARLAEIRGFRLDWIVQQFLMLRQWDVAGPSTGQMIQSLQAMYEIMEDTEAPAVRLGVADMLANRYSALGNTTNAQKWAAVAKAQPIASRGYERFLEGSDDFFRALEEAPNCLDDAEKELEALRAELLQVVKDVDVDSTPALRRYMGIRRVIAMCKIYIRNFELWGFSRAKRLVETCLESSDTLLQILPASHKEKWEAQVVNVKARLLFVEGLYCVKPEPKVMEDLINRSSLMKSIEMSQEAASLFLVAGDEMNSAFAQEQAASCYRAIWQVDESPRTATSFGQAVESYESAIEILRRTAVNLQQIVVAKLLTHWFEGYTVQVEYVPPRPFKSSFWEAISCLDELKRLVNDQRQDLSALERQEAIIAKQSMRNNPHVSLLYKTGTLLYARGGLYKELWVWLQESKARSLSDLLGLGVNIPIQLRETLDADPQAAELLAEEERLARRIKSVAPVNRLFARKELEQHRRAMRSHDSLRELLDIRQGAPVPWGRLAKLSGSGRRTWFIDWFTGDDGDIGFVAVSGNEEHYHMHRLEMTSKEVTQWIDGNLLQDTPLRVNGWAALAQLKPLISPLLDLTKEGDLLIFCMTGDLHKIPVHATVIGEFDPEADDHETLIERNPILYVSSMTIFDQCMTRAPRSRSGAHKGVVLGVYEEPDEGAWEGERRKIYDMCESLADRMEWGESTCGRGAGKSRFQAACEADIVHFSGHFEKEPKDQVLSHGIRLAAETGSDGGNEANPGETDEPAPTEVFSISDMFATRVAASHVSLIACGSASQHIQQGDEPLSIVSALLCAGARSVLGTLWPIYSGAGRAFSEAFYKPIVPDAEGARSIDLAVALQKAVADMKGESDTSAPYYWAGFVLHGAWRLD